MDCKLINFMEKKFGKLLAGCLAALACFSCGPQIPTNYTDSTDAAAIYPDYRDVTLRRAHQRNQR